MSDVPILKSEAEVEALADELMQESSVAIDLEMDAMHNYREKICLAQVSTANETWIVDPLTGGELSPLAPVFASSEIRKIFHAIDYDLRSLKRDYGFAVHNLFDTMIAAQFCGEEKIGLADLLNKYFNIELDKKYQRADWSQRPMKDEMILYAAEDTRHLHRLAAILEKKLRALGRMDWLKEECRRLEEIEFDRNSGPFFLRFKGAGRLERRQLAELEELLQWRDREAERRNCPHFKVVGNKPLLAMVQRGISAAAEMKGIEGLSERQIGRYGKQLVTCLERGRSLEAEKLPQYPRPARTRKDPQADRLLTRLKSWRTAKAAELNLDPGVLINNSLLETISRLRPRRIDDLSQVAEMRRWQVELLGSDILAQIG